MTQSRVAEFHDFLTSLPSLYRSVDVSVVAIHAESAWRNIRTQCTLHDVAPARLRPRRHQIDSAILRTIHVALPIDHLTDLLGDVECGEWRANGIDIRYLQSQFGAEARPYVLNEAHFFGQREQWRHPAFEWSGYVLHGAGDSCSDIVNRVPGGWTALERVARRSPHAPGSVDRIASEFTGVAFSLGSYATVFELYAPLAARLHDAGCVVRPGSLQYELRAGSKAAAGACCIHATPIRQTTRADDVTDSISGFTWSRAAEGYRVTGSLALRACSAVRLKLNVGGEVVDELELEAADPLPRLEQGPRLILPSHTQRARHGRTLSSPRRTPDLAASRVATENVDHLETRLPNVGRVPESARGMAILDELVHRPAENGGLGWLFRRQLEADVGVDGHIEVVGAAGDPRAATGRLMAVQVKAGPTYFARTDGEAWVVRVPRKTAAYWRDLSLPVLLVLVDLARAICYWARADVHPIPPGRTVRIRVPFRNVLSADARDIVRALTSELPG